MTTSATRSAASSWRGAGVFDKPTILARLPELLSLFEDGGPRMTITKVFQGRDWIIAERSGAGRFLNGTDDDNRYVILDETVDGRVRTVREYMDTQHAAQLFAAAVAS
jgi:hypothetical protein